MSDENKTDDKGPRPDDTRPKEKSGIVPAPSVPPSEPSSAPALPMPGEPGFRFRGIDSKIEPLPSKRGGTGALIAWVLLALTIAACTWFVIRQYLPLQEELADTRIKLADTQKAGVSLKDEIKGLESSQAELAAQVAKREAELQALTSTQDELSKKLQSEIDKGNVAIKQSQGQIVVDLVDKILFPSGEAELSDQGKGILKQVGETFLKVPDKVIQIGGHTDDVPISPKLKDRFPSNWELSAARSLNVVHYLQDEIKVPGTRLVASALAEYRPKASNKTVNGRKKNRRIEVVLLPLTPGGK